MNKIILNLLFYFKTLLSYNFKEKKKDLVSIVIAINTRKKKRKFLVKKQPSIKIVSLKVKKR